MTPIEDGQDEFDDSGRYYYFCQNLDLTDSNDPDLSEPREKCIKQEANLISSECKDGLHRPVIDLDIPAKYIPSTTKDHGHLYINVPLTWEKYEKLLTVMEECGIIQTGFLKRSCERKSTFVRPPWVKKEPVTKSELRNERYWDDI